jgi:hypothetical protein
MDALTAIHGKIARSNARAPGAYTFGLTENEAELLHSMPAGRTPTQEWGLCVAGASHEHRPPTASAAIPLLDALSSE